MGVAQAVSAHVRELSFVGAAGAALLLSCGPSVASVDALAGAPSEQPQTLTSARTVPDQRSQEQRIASMPNAPNVKNTQDFQLPAGNEVGL